ncbi:uncharacterized protein isoform X2 [Choristoneura fumiferana]|uniref:uncharacterized protein isoform X2 n=1 Tax=Choristoneura fumiferana TaxID=7141 RepID=UPI003D15F08C
MFEERKINVCEGVPLNSTSSEKPADVGVHINTTLSIASSKKIKLLFVLNFLLSVVCIIVSTVIAFYYWNELMAMRRQLDSMKDQFIMQTLRDNIHQDKLEQSALISNLRPPYRGSVVREPRMDTSTETPPRKYYVEDLGEDMLLVDSSKKTDKGEVPQLELPIFQKEPLVVQFNGAKKEINLGQNAIIGPWQRDMAVSSKGSETKIELDTNFVTVKESGLYLIYAQIVYLSRAPNCYYIWARQPGQEGRLLSTCATGDDSSNRDLSKSQMSCSVQTVARLNKGDTVNLAQREPNRTLWLRPGHSYFGFVKLSS